MWIAKHNDPNIKKFTPEAIKDMFSNKINWKLYNNIQHILTKHEDVGFSIYIEIRAYDVDNDYFYIIYKNNESWKKQKTYIGVENNCYIIYYIEILNDDNPNKCSEILNNMCKKLTKRYKDLLISKIENGRCEYYAMNGDKDGKCGYSIDIRENNTKL